MAELKVSEKTRKVVADILTQFMFTKDMDEVVEVWKSIYDRFELCDDPFTGAPCTEQEYCRNLLEYEKQVMMKRYGHCDGLE